jgi:hypothetical protein
MQTMMPMKNLTNDKWMAELLFPERRVRREPRMTAEDVVNKILEGKNGPALAKMIKDFKLDVLQ